MQDCQICLETIPRIPLLKCGHFICAECYCSCKNRGITNCSVCDKKLVRSFSKKNK